MAWRTHQTKSAISLQCFPSHIYGRARCSRGMFVNPGMRCRIHIEISGGLFYLIDMGTGVGAQ
jgi:hypothetical protein